MESLNHSLTASVASAFFDGLALLDSTGLLTVSALLLIPQTGHHGE
jgi:hypothetical protein